MKQIEETILDTSPGVSWDDIQGLADVKSILNETIVLPALKPEFFSGIRAPSRGILLYGPPGNGKTMLAKAIASECKSTFFNCSASSLMSKWMGEGEKIMRALFYLAAEKAPAVIFIDEIDSIMGARGGNEHEASRRLKTEFLIQFDGVSSAAASEKQLLVLAATNRPFDLDEAALRRLTRRIYLPLPDKVARQAIIESKLKGVKHQIENEQELDQVAELTQGYSAADLVFFCKEAAMMPVREIPTEELMKMKNTEDVRGVGLQDFTKARQVVTPSVSGATIAEFEAWQRSKGAA